MWIDTHCHLDAAEFSADRDVVAAAAVEAGVKKIVVPAVAVPNFAAVRDCCQRYPGCVAAYGIHPMYTPQASDDDLLTLREWLVRERPVAVVLRERPHPEQIQHLGDVRWVTRGSSRIRLPEMGATLANSLSGPSSEAERRRGCGREGGRRDDRASEREGLLRRGGPRGGPERIVPRAPTGAI